MESEPRSRVDKVSAAASVNTADMIRISGGTFRMGSDKHYPEEAPVHRVTVSDFLIDRTPITNRQFRAFVQATGHVTFAGSRPIRRYRPAARHAQPIDTSTSHVGFRCVVRERKDS